MKTRILLLFALSVCAFQAYAQFKTVKAVHPSRTGPGVSQTTDAPGSALSYHLCDDNLEFMSGANAGDEIRTWIRIPAKQWRGNKITSMDIGFGWEAGKDAYLFISKDLDQEPGYKQEFPADTVTVPDGADLIGWRAMPLKTPYVIDSDEDLYVGFCVTQDFYPPLAVDGKDPLPGGNLASRRKSGTTEWTYAELPHNVAVRVNLEGENFQQYNLHTLSCSTPAVYNKPGEININGDVINEGISPINSFILSCQLDGESPVSKQITGVTIPPSGIYTFTLPCPTQKEGKRTVTLTVSEPNGEVDEFPENTSASHVFGCLSRGIQKTVLINEAVGLDEEAVPDADLVIQNAIEANPAKEQIIWIRNHALADDDLSIQGYSNYSNLFPQAPWIPSVQIDHTRLEGTFQPSNLGDPVKAQSEMFLVDEHFNEHLQTALDDQETYLSVAVTAEMTDGNTLKYTITGSPAIEGLYANDIYQPCLALLLVEDKVASTQAGASESYLQRFTPRTFIDAEDPDFAFAGDQFTISDEGFTKEGEYVLTDPSWKLENLHLVAYVMDGRDMRIKNAATCPLLKPDALQQTEDPALFVHYKEGQLRIDGKFDRATVYTLTGEAVATTSDAGTELTGATKGIYLVKIQCGTTNFVRKIVVE